MYKRVFLIKGDLTMNITMTSRAAFSAKLGEVGNNLKDKLTKARLADSEEVIKGYVAEIGRNTDVVDLKDADNGHVAVHINGQQIKGRTSNKLNSLKLRLHRLAGKHLGDWID